MSWVKKFFATCSTCWYNHISAHAETCYRTPTHECKKNCAGRRVIIIIRYLCYIASFLTYFKFSLLINEHSYSVQLTFVNNSNIMWLYLFHLCYFSFWTNLNFFTFLKISNNQLKHETMLCHGIWLTLLCKNVISSYDPNETMATRKIHFTI